MAKRRKRVQVPVRRVTKEPEPEPVVEEAVEEAEEANGDYTQWTVADLRAECEQRDLPTTGRKSTLVQRLLKDDEGEPEEEPEQEAPKAKPTRRRARPAAKRQPKKEPEPAAEEIGLAEGSLALLFDAMAPGTIYVITRIDEDTWQFSIAGEGAVAAAAKPKGKGLRGDAFWTEVLTEAYYQFFKVDCGSGKAWEDMDVEEKYAFAEEANVSWEEHDDDKVDMMRLVKALMQEFDIVKYKPEYATKAAREALK